MKKILYFLCLLLNVSSFAQQSDIEFGKNLSKADLTPPAGDIIKKDATAIYFVSLSDTNTITSLDFNKQIYRLYTKSHQLIEEGQYDAHQYEVCKENEWKAYHKNGKVKAIGHYESSAPVGTWEEYFSNGHLRKRYHYVRHWIQPYYTTTVMAGSYEEYYANGKMKTTGAYGIVVDSAMDTTMVIDPITNDGTVRIEKRLLPNSRKLGRWKYYSETGEIIKEENLY